MIAKSLVVSVLVAAAVVCGQGVLGDTFRMEVREHGDFLESMKPAITKVSKAIADAAKGGEELEHVLTGVISKDLVVQMKKLSEVMKEKASNGTNAPPTCCICGTCPEYYFNCGCPCCYTGSGCTCYNCKTKEAVHYVEKISLDENDPYRLWSKSTKAMLKGDITRSVVATTKTSDSCCTCSQCRQKSNGCESKSCCSDGDDCVCGRCSDSSVDLIASSIWNPLSLTQEVEHAIEKVNDLVNMMSLYVN